MITNVVVENKRLIVYLKNGKTLILSLDAANELKQYLNELL